MPRKRKIADVNKENAKDQGNRQQQQQQQVLSQSQGDDGDKEATTLTNPNTVTIVEKDAMYHVLSAAQINETFHKKYIKEMQELYKNMDHEVFMNKFITLVKSAMEAEEKNEYAHTALLFSAKFASSFHTEETHPVLLSTFEWLLSTISVNAHIRFRLCQFVNFILNSLGNEASLEDTTCDKIMTYMLERLRDINPNVRIQAILALQRLQNPENPDDLVVKAYQFHLSSDPSPRVRQAVITSIGRNYHTLPFILERLWDVDEKVRRHTYLQMSSYPVKAYKVTQRIKFLEQGLNDRSMNVRKVVTSVLLQQWFESYNRNFIKFISALKLDADEDEIDRFRKITKVALKEMFKKCSTEELLKNLPFDKQSDTPKLIPLTELSVEVTLYWLTLIEYLQDSDDIDEFIPELSEFCEYIRKYCMYAKKEMDKWEKLEHEYIILTLIEIVDLYDLGDEIGRRNLKELLDLLLREYDLGERIIKKIIKCMENLIDHRNKRLQFFVDIINDLLDTKSSKLNDLNVNRVLIDQYLENVPETKMRYSAIKLKLLELKEQEANLIVQKEYAKAEKLTEELNRVRDQYNNMMKTLRNEISNIPSSSNDEPFPILEELRPINKVTQEVIVKCLKITFYMLASKNVSSLSPSACRLYQEFICRYTGSNSITIRDWALKCSTTYAMLYEQISKDVFTELYSQFFNTTNTKIWKTAIECIFELIDRYGFANLNIEEKTTKNPTRKHTRQLYNTLEFLDKEDENPANVSQNNQVSVMYMMSHFLDSCVDTGIITSTTKGFCRLILHDHLQNDDIFEKLLLKYFNPTTDTETNQVLGVFFESIMKLKKQEYLQPCLLPTISTILSAPYDSPLREIKPETVTKFIIDSTRPEFCVTGLNIHNTIAMSFIQEILNNISNRELLRILSKELLSLELSLTEDSTLRDDLKSSCEKILQHEVDQSVAKNIVNFKEMLDGNFKQSTAKRSNEADEDNNSEKEEREVEGTAINQESDDSDDTETSGTLATTAVVHSQKGPTSDDKNKEKTFLAPPTPTKTPASDTESNIFAVPAVPVPPPQLKTTYGEKNQTKMRYLRKSLNLREKGDSSDDSRPTRPPKIRIEAALASPINKHLSFLSSLMNNSNSGNSPKEIENNETVNRNSMNQIENLITQTVRTTMEKRRSSQLSSSSEESLDSRVSKPNNSEKVKHIKKRGRLQKDAEKEQPNQKSENNKLVPKQKTAEETSSSTTIQKSLRSRRNLQNKFISSLPPSTTDNKKLSTRSNRTSRTKNLNTSIEELSQASDDESNTETSDVNIRILSSPPTPNEISPKTPVVQKPQRSRGRPRKINTPNEMQKRATRYDLTASAENRIKTSKYPLVRILYKTTSNENIKNDNSNNINENDNKICNLNGPSVKKRLDLDNKVYENNFNKNKNNFNNKIITTKKLNSNSSSGSNINVNSIQIIRINNLKNNKINKYNHNLKNNKNPINDSKSRNSRTSSIVVTDSTNKNKKEEIQKKNNSDNGIIGSSGSSSSKNSNNDNNSVNNSNKQRGRKKLNENNTPLNVNTTTTTAKRNTEELLKIKSQSEKIANKNQSASNNKNNDDGLHSYQTRTQKHKNSVSSKDPTITPKPQHTTSSSSSSAVTATAASRNLRSTVPRIRPKRLAATRNTNKKD